MTDVYEHVAIVGVVDWQESDLRYYISERFPGAFYQQILLSSGHPMGKLWRVSWFDPYKNLELFTQEIAMISQEVGGKVHRIFVTEHEEISGIF